MNTRDLFDRLLRPIKMRMANMIARAVVSGINDAKKLQLLQIGVEHGVDLDDAEHFHPYGLSSVPLSGAEGIALFPGGDRGHPLVPVVSDRRYRPTGMQPGEVALHIHIAGKVIKIDVTGIVHLGEAGLGASDGVVHGTGVDIFTGKTYHALGSTSAAVRAKK